MTADFRGGADGPDNGAQPAPGKLSFRGASARHSARAIPAAWAERLWGWLRLCLNGQDLAELSPAAGDGVRPERTAIFLQTVRLNRQRSIGIP